MATKHLRLCLFLLLFCVLLACGDEGQAPEPLEPPEPAKLPTEPPAATDLDLSQPLVFSELMPITDPSSGTSEVAANSYFSITFSDPIQPDALNIQVGEILGEMVFSRNTVEAGTFDRLKWTPHAPLPLGKAVLEISATSRFGLHRDFQVPFIVVEADHDPPQFLGFSLVNRAKLTHFSGEFGIDFSFNEIVNVRNAKLSFEPDTGVDRLGRMSKVQVSDMYARHHKVLRLLLSTKFLKEIVYQVTLVGVEDYSGNRAAPQTITFEIP